MVHKHTIDVMFTLKSYLFYADTIFLYSTLDLRAICLHEFVCSIKLHVYHETILDDIQLYKLNFHKSMSLHIELFYVDVNPFNKYL